MTLQVRFDGSDDLPEPFAGYARWVEVRVAGALLRALNHGRHHRREDPAASALHTAYRHKTRHR